MITGILKIGPEERRTFALHMIYSIINGLIMGIFALNEFILIKSMKGSNYQIGLIVQSTVIVLSFSLLINIFLQYVRRKERFIRLVGIITRLPMFLFILFPSVEANPQNAIFYQMAFILIFLIYYMADPLLLPVINHLLKNSYSYDNFGRLYGFASSINKVMMLISTFGFGLLLDYDHDSYRYIYPTIAFLGIISIYVLTLIKYGPGEIPAIKQGFAKEVKESIKASINILKINKPFRHFENAFFLYGLAWMATAAVIPIFFEKKLGLNYSSVAFYKNSYNTISILILPFLGKIIGKIDPRKFAIITFSAMLLHVLFMAFTEYFPIKFEIMGITLYYSLIVSYSFYGIFGALMALLWYIGSAYFCKKEEVSNYQAIHVSLTGVRGFLAPLLGILLLDYIGYAGVFLASAFSLGVAIYIMFFSIKKHSIKNPVIEEIPLIAK